MPLFSSPLHNICHMQAPVKKSQDKRARLSFHLFVCQGKQLRLQEVLIIKTIKHVVVVLVVYSLGKGLYCRFRWSWNYCRLQPRVLQETNANLAIQVNIYHRKWTASPAMLHRQKDFGKLVQHTSCNHTHVLCHSSFIQLLRFYILAWQFFLFPVVIKMCHYTCQQLKKNKNNNCQKQTNTIKTVYG